MNVEGGHKPDPETRFSLAAWQRELRDASRMRDVSASAAATALWLETFADHGTGLNARPAVETLAAIQQVSVATIRRHLKELSAAGFIERTHGHTRNRPATYAIRMRNARVEDTNVGSYVQNQTQNLQQPARQTAHERHLTSNTAYTSYDLSPNAIIGERYSPPTGDLQELVGYLLEAVVDEHVWLPNLDLDSDEQRAEMMVREVIHAHSEAGVRDPISYLRSVYQKDGAFRFGLAIREKWKFGVGMRPPHYDDAPK